VSKDWKEVKGLCLGGGSKNPISYYRILISSQCPIVKNGCLNNDNSCGIGYHPQ
jgi:hypothetical protein